MSERLKETTGSDTSTFNKHPNKSNVVKNPLLSASVTNFDDLSSLPLLLPAAPPPAIIQPTREPKSLVTVGKSSDIDSDILDEINLNAAPIEDLGPPPIIETNTDPLDQGIVNDSLLSQAASSFSALPSVASSVFSTFSKRIYAGSSREQTPSIDNTNGDLNANSNISQLDIQPSYIQQQQQQKLTGPLASGATSTESFTQPYYAPPPIDGNLNLGQVETSVPEPPKFYTPTEVPTISATAPPLSGSSQNTYRLSAKKKLYAPIPGLSEQSQPLPTLTPINTTPASYSSVPQAYETPAEPKQDERKGGLFSLTNLVPTGVLQNITGLVQTAAGTLGQSVKSENITLYSKETTPLQSPISIGTTQNQEGQQEQSGPTAVPQSEFYSPNYGIPNQSFSQANFFVPPPVGYAFESNPPQSDLSSQNLVPPGANIVPSNISPVENTKVPVLASSINFFNPTKSSTDATFNQPNSDFPNTNPEVPSFVLSAQPSDSSVNFLSSSSENITVGSAPFSGHQLILPPKQIPIQPPPPSVGNASYRLQKGTRLYKSPLTANETAPLTVNPQQPHHSLGVGSQPTVFNPFATNSSNEYTASVTSTLPIEKAVDYFVPQSNTKENSEQNYSVNPLSTTTETDLTSKPALQSGFEPLSQKQPIQTEKIEKETEPLKATPLVVSPTSASAKPVVDTSSTLYPVQTDSDLIKEQTLTQHDIVLQPPPPAVKLPVKESTESILEPSLRGQDHFAHDKISSDFSTLSLGTQQPPFQTSTALPPPPPVAVSTSVNPYRKGLSVSSVGSAQPTLASFFTPTLNVDQGASGDFSSSIQQNLFTSPPIPNTVVPPTAFDIPNVAENLDNATSNITNFFSTPPAAAENKVVPEPSNDLPTLPSYCSPIVPEVIETEKITETPISGTNIPPPIGFDNSLPSPDIQEQNVSRLDNPSKPVETVQQFEEPTRNAFSNFFGQSVHNLQQERITTSQTQEKNFFDSFSATPTINPVVKTNLTPSPEITDSTNNSEDQVLQNFFNNPPPKENSSGVGDLNYDLVHSGLGIRTQHTGSLTTASNIVEPPSSACSEFSELNNSASSQRILLQQSIGLAGEDPTSVSLPTKVVETLHEENLEHKEEENLLKDHCNDLPEEILKELRMANISNNDKMAASSPPTATATVIYTPAVKHWFFKRPVGSKFTWTPFSHYDSALLETSFISNDENQNIVAVEGGRYDVNIRERLKRPVYWEGEPIEVRRCSWFYKATDSKYIPYEETAAQYLEEEYKKAAESGVWHKKIAIGTNEQVVFHGPTVIVHFQQLQSADNWGGTTQTTSRPRIVKRDLDDFTIEQGESQRVDHLLLMVHGIGSACDLKMRSVEEVVDDFRSIAMQLVQSHYKNSTDMGIVGRVEVLPISWHSHLHSEEMGIDEKLKSITLESIPKLRNFTNDTLLDVLFYTSPTFCQKIITTVVTAMNTLYLRYRERHPEFTGGVSLAGHSLGSLILFDLLCHQKPIKECEEQNLENPNMPFTSCQLSENNQAIAPELHNVISQQISYNVGPAGTGQPFIQYAQLVFQPKKFFALGSPIGMFVTIRGIDKLGLDFRLPTCPGFYNIFHPFDPVAYRIEALVNPDMSGIRPVLIPHHKGRKRMHLELKETMTRVGADLKQRFLDTFKTTLESVNFLGSSRSKKEAEESMEKEVDKVIAMQMEVENEEISQAAIELPASSVRSRANSNSTTQSDTDLVEVDFPLGKLNDSKRIDYVLQEAPLEFFNEYLFALSSHVCYWDSSDTILFVMKEIYSGLGISPDSQVPQQTMTIERPSSRNSVSQSILPPSN